MRPAVLPLLLLSACVSGPSEIEAVLPGTPDYLMLPGRTPLPEGSHSKTDCGPETVAAALNFLGIQVSVSEAEREIYLPSIQGSTTLGIVAFARRKGATAKVTERGGLWKIEEHIKARSPLIIEVTRSGQYHYYFVVGFNRAARVVVVAHYGNRQQTLPFELLDELWSPIFYRSISFSVTPLDQMLEEGLDFLEGGRYEQAEDRFTQALRLQPECGLALYGMGRIRIHRQRRAEALDYLERAFKLLPTIPEVLNDLADTLLELKGDGARAVRLARSAVDYKLKQIAEFEEELKFAPPGTRARVEEDLRKARENTFYFHGTLGQSLEAAGSLKESIGARLESLKYPHLEEDDPDAPARRHLEIALAYRAMNLPELAGEHFQKAMGLAKSEEMRRRIDQNRNVADK